MMKTDLVMKQMTLEEKAALCSGADFWHLQGVPRLGIPSLMATDGPHGLRKQLEASDHLGINVSEESICFPTAVTLASSFDRALLKDVGATLGRECQARDVSILLGPGANIKRSPLCGRNFEYFSEDPYLSSELCAAYITGLQGEGIACSVKHFTANNQETDRMLSDSVLDERTLHEIYLASFEGPIRDAKAKTVMCSYNKVNGTYLSENHDLLTGVLRERWGFEGFVVTDWGAVKNQIVGLKAGLDLKMPGGNPADADAIIAAVHDGFLDVAVLDKAVSRIIDVIRFAMMNKQEGVQFDYQTDHAKAMQVATECAVLLKNNNGLLPLDRSAKIAFIGEFAQKPRFQGGGSSHINAYRVDSAVWAAMDLENITYAKGYDLVSDTTSNLLLREATGVAKKADVAVVFVGLPDKYESEGFDRSHINLPAAHDQLVQAVCAVQPNTVVVLHNGSCVAMPWVDAASAILEMSLGGEAVGNATVKLLFGDAVPSGKLAETFPCKLEDNPTYLNFPGFRGVTEYREGIYVGYRYYDSKRMDVLFPFGHGLSYTQFEYSNLVLDKVTMQDVDTLQVTVDVKNIGAVAGKEVVQLYVKSRSGEVPRPEHELRGFEKIALLPGEKKTVSFSLSKRAFAYYNSTIHDWHVETANYEVQIGASSRDIRLTALVQVNSTVELPFTFTQYSSIGQILKSAKGREILAPIIQAMQNKATITKEDMNAAMGEGSDEMRQALMMQMPLQNLAGFGFFPAEVIEQIVSALNK